MAEFAKKIMKKCPKLKINVYPIENKTFGKNITVTGLLTGRDIYEGLKDKELGDDLYIPANSLREVEGDFLCGMHPSELAAALGVNITAAASAEELVRYICRLD